MKKAQYILVLVCCLWVGCGGRGPQRPTYKSGQQTQEDTVEAALADMNMRMAQEADKAVFKYVEAQDEAYAQLELTNAWMRIAEHGDTDGPTPKDNELWQMHLRVKDLSGRLLLDEEREYRIGRSELPICADVACNEWHHGDHIVMIAPWYSAYGMHGNEDIPPYSNVLIDIEIK